MSAFLRRAVQALLPSILLVLLLPALLVTPTGATFIEFENCLSDATLNDKPTQLQWVPLFVDANFDTDYPNNLKLTFYGNVTGQQVRGPYPPPDSESWRNASDEFGKIANVGSGNHYSTLFTSFHFLSYDAYTPSRSRFCSHLTQGDCPLGPQFYADPDDPSDLAAFTVSHEFKSSFQLSTLNSHTYLISGDVANQTLMCINANITPAFGSAISAMLVWLPAAILIFKGIAVLAAAIYSPWGSSDIFTWSSNFDRNDDLLRLVTPGFGDCLQYIQFITLLGSLTLQYPGFFQPAVSKTAWSLLLFNESWVTNGPGTQALVDGMYNVNASYGISEMTQLIGMSAPSDAWASMAIWLAVIAAIVIVLTQVGFLIRWLHRTITKTSEQDLRQKNLPFTLGNMIRLAFNFFVLPIITLSLFQLVISDQSPTSVVAVAAVVIAIWILSAAWILYVIFTTRPHEYLTDDMPTLLLYGPLYNTYRDGAAPFAFIPLFLTFMRGIAFGGAQPSGTGQVIVLAISEIVLIVTLLGFKPFTRTTSMNAYYTVFAFARLVCVLLSITFIGSLNVSEGTKGWIGYTILVIHACILVFGFFLNSLMTIVEVIARSLGLASGAGGGILNWRMLKKRQDRPATPGSQAAMREADEGHHRSMSASSQQLLNQAGGNTPSSHRLSGLDNISNGGEPGESPNMGYSYLPAPTGQSPIHGRSGSKSEAEMFYRPPRKRTMTNEALGPVLESMSEDSPRHAIAAPIARSGTGGTDSPRHPFAASIARSGTDSPRPAFFRDRADSGAQSVRTDYAVREADQYYRGAALNDQQTRKLRTGPADPISPAANAQSWFQGLWGGLTGMNRRKEKESGKGFEVVRSSRMPPELQREIQRQEELEMQEKTKPGLLDVEEGEEAPYRDYDGAEEAQAVAGAERVVPTPGDKYPVQVLASKSKEGFDFGFDRNQSTSTSATRDMRPGSAPVRDGSARMPGGSGQFVLPEIPIVTRDPNHPGIRAEQPSVRPSTAREQENVSSYDLGLGYMTRASGENAEFSDGEDDDWRASKLSDQAPSLDPLDVGDGLGIPSFSRGTSQRSVSGGSQTDRKWSQLLARDHSRRDYSQRLSRQPPPQPDTYTPTGLVAGPSTTAGAPRSPDEDTLQRHETISSLDDGDPQFLGVPSSDPLSEEEQTGGYFQTSYHRAGDSITRNSFGANAALRGAEAEIVGGSFTEGEGEEYLERGDSKD